MHTQHAEHLVRLVYLKEANLICQVVQAISEHWLDFFALPVSCCDLLPLNSLCTMSISHSFTDALLLLRFVLELLA